MACLKPKDNALTPYRLLAILLGLLTPVWLPVLPAEFVWFLGTGAVVVMPCKRLRALAVFLLAAAWACWCAEQQWSSLAVEDYNQNLMLTGQIVSIPRISTDLARFQLRINTPVHLQGETLLVSWYRSQHIPELGERWRFSARVRPPVGAINPFGFDYAQSLLTNGHIGTAVVRDAGRLQPTPLYSISWLRKHLADWIDNHLSAQSAALARALLIGDRSRITTSQQDSLIATGTAHLLAISGMHIGLMAWLGYWLARGSGYLLLPIASKLRMGWFSLSAHTSALLLSIILASIYAALAGMVVSTQRALLMLVLLIVAVLLRRHLLAGRLLLIAAVLLLISNPMLALGPAVWLSFAAVFWLYYGFSGRVSEPQRSISAKVMLLLRAQVIIMLGLLPIQLLWFQQLSLVMLPANLITIPLISLLVLPLLIIAAVCYILQFPAYGVTLDIVDKLLIYISKVLELFVSHSTAVIHAVPLNMSWIGIAMIGALWVLAPRGVPMRCLGLVLLAPLFLQAGEARLQPGHWQLVVFDSGQGQAVAVRTASSLWVYDTGPGDGLGRDTVAGSILPLLYHWRQPVDGIIISHGDLDHAGGLASLYKVWPAARIYSSDRQLGEHCSTGLSWQHDGVRFTFLHPGQYLPYLKNDSSCVLRIDSAFGSALLPGDISQVVERRLLQSNAQLAADVLLMPHHGSKSSSSAAFLNAVKPAIAVASTGVWNRF